MAKQAKGELVGHWKCVVDPSIRPSYHRTRQGEQGRRRAGRELKTVIGSRSSSLSSSSSLSYRRLRLRLRHHRFRRRHCPCYCDRALAAYRDAELRGGIVVRRSTPSRHSRAQHVDGGRECCRVVVVPSRHLHGAHRVSLPWHTDAAQRPHCM